MQHFVVEHIDVYLDALPTDMPKRKAEQKGKATMLRAIFGDGATLTYSEEGKPMFSDGYISLSHSRHHICMAYSATREVGIDIEEIQPRLERLRSRYLSEEELMGMENSLRNLAICWSAKEAIYKIVGSAAGAVGEHIRLHTEQITDTADTFTAECGNRYFRLYIVQQTDQYEIVLAVETKVG